MQAYRFTASPASRILYVLMTFWKLYRGFILLSAALHVLAPCMALGQAVNSVRSTQHGDKQQRGDCWRGIPFCVCHVVLCLGLKSSDDLSKATLALWWPLVRSVTRKNRPAVDPEARKLFAYFFVFVLLDALPFLFLFLTLYFFLKDVWFFVPVSNLKLPGQKCTKYPKNK